MRYIRGRRGILEVDAADAVFSQTPNDARQWPATHGQSSHQFCPGWLR